MTGAAYLNWNRIFLALIGAGLVFCFGMFGYYIMDFFYRTSYRLVSVFLIIILFSNFMKIIAVKFLKSYERPHKG